MNPTHYAGRSLTIQEVNLRALPKWALLAFAARCARRVVYLYKPSDAETLPIARVRHALEIAERAATIGKSKEGIYAHGGPQQAYEAFQCFTYDGFNPNDPASCARAAVNGAVDAQMMIAAGETDQANLPADGAVQAARQAAQTLEPDRAEMVVTGICEDYEVLREAAIRGSWTDDTPVPVHFFPHHLVFKADRQSLRDDILNIQSRLDEKLVEYFRRDPSRLHAELRPRQFEELVAELFDGFGFKVELTQQTRDDGKDIIAIKHNATQEKYLIECKLWNTKRVGIEVVQRLYGVVKLDGAHKGIIASTSGFSAPARRTIAANWELQGADLDCITRWLEAYQRSRILRALGLGALP